MIQSRTIMQLSMPPSSNSPSYNIALIPTKTQYIHKNSRAKHVALVNMLNYISC